MAGRWDSVAVNGATMRCYVGAPDGAGPFPALVVIQHAGGVDEFTRTMADRFASAGYVAIAPELYHRETPEESGDNFLTRMGRLRDAEIVPDVTAAIEHLKTLANVRADRIGIAGFCMGGRVTYPVATHSPELRAAVVFYGGNIMVPWGEGPAPFDRSQRIGCAVLGLFGEQDANPSPADVAKLDGELTRLGKVHEFHSYGGVGHAFMVQTRPGYREEVAEDAWAECLGWLKRYLA